MEEYPTQTGPADYALFVKGQLLGIIEAKKLSVGVYAAIEQAKRYAKGVNNTVGQWRGYNVPFLYSTNGELIYHLEDEREFNADEIEEKVTSPDSTEKIIRAVKKYTDRHKREYKRFPKTWKITSWTP